MKLTSIAEMQYKTPEKFQQRNQMGAQYTNVDLQDTTDYPHIEANPCEKALQIKTDKIMHNIKKRKRK